MTLHNILGWIVEPACYVSGLIIVGYLDARKRRAILNRARTVCHEASESVARESFREGVEFGIHMAVESAKHAGALPPDFKMSIEAIPLGRPSKPEIKDEKAQKEDDQKFLRDLKIKM